MISREQYYQTIIDYFSFLVNDYNYKISSTNQSNSLLYDVEYSNGEGVISISFEVIGENVNVVIFSLINGKKSNYDDAMNTFHLNKLLKGISKEKMKNNINLNISYFKNCKNATSDVEKMVLKKAKELRLYLLCKQN